MRIQIKACRLHDVREFLRIYGYGAFFVDGYREESDGLLPVEVWTIESASAEIGSIRYPITDKLTPRNVSMLIIDRIEKWRKEIYGR